MKTPEVGDIVHIKARVTAVAQNDVSVYITNSITVWVSTSNIVHVEATPLKVGDRVVWTGAEKEKGVLVAIDQTASRPLAWMRGRYHGDLGLVVILDELERV